MKRINRYILRQIWIPALSALVVISFIFIGGAIQREVRALLQDVPMAPITLWDISRISLYSSPMLVGYILPVTFLMGIMLTFGKMARNSELIAMKAAGIPLGRTVLPVLWTGAALSLICLLVQDGAQPWAYRKLHSLLKSDLPLRATLDVFPTGVMQDYGDWRVYIGRRDQDGKLHNLVVLQALDGGKAKAFYADKAWLEKAGGRTSLVMRKGRMVDAERDGVLPHTTFRTMRLPIPDPPIRSDVIGRQGMDLRQLFAEERKATKTLHETSNKMVELELYKLRTHMAHRFSLPLMCLAVAFLAAPIGARASRSGRSFTFAGGFAIIVAYYVIRALAAPHHLPGLGEAVLLAQVPNAVLMALGGVLIWRVDRV